MRGGRGGRCVAGKKSSREAAAGDGNMAQGEARERVGSGLDPKSRGIHGRTTSRGVA